MRRFRFQANVASLLLAFLCALDWATSAVAQSTTLTGVVVKGRKYTGKVMFRDANTLGLLRRDGGLSTYSIEDIESTKNLAKRFSPYSRDELEERLRSEFSKGYSVAFTDNFAVVYPPNSAFGWATTFERYFRLFTHYFEARGFVLTRSEFPMIAIVLRTRAEFDRYLEQIDLENPANIVGIYSMKTNRIITFDQAMATSPKRANENLLTVIHEAAHQSAFNTGVHERFRPVPRWVSEGLATMFEAKGVHNSIDNPQFQDRLATVYLHELQGMIAEDSFRGNIKSIVCSDELFADEPRTAYATAWGLTFYLAESRPQAYLAYLQSTKRGKDFSRDGDGAERRLEDFCAAFGNDLRDLETRLIQFSQDLPTER